MHRPPAFTIDTPTQFDIRDWPTESYGPAWVTFDDDGDVVLDSPSVAGPGLWAFARRAVAAARRANPDVVHTVGTVYAVRHPIGCTAGDLHFDGGHYDDLRNVTRVVMSLSTDDTPLANTFLRSTLPRFAERLAGLRVDDIPHSLTVQPVNGQLAVFDEGLHLHGRPAVDISRDPAAYGIFCSVALYCDDTPVDLHCPRLADLRGYGPHASRADGHTTARTSF